MDFELTKAQKDIQKAAREFAKGEFDKELAVELEEKHEFPTSIWKKAGELGFIGLHFPEEYGGQDYGCLENALVVEEFCRRDSSIGSALMFCDFASENVLRYGTDEQKQAYLPPIAVRRAIFGGAFTEPDHGSDITRMATTAVRDGDDWVINGVKTFITNGGIAALLHRALPDRPRGRPQGSVDDHRPRRRRGPRDRRRRPEDGHPHDPDRRAVVQGRPRAGREPARQGGAGLLPGPRVLRREPHRGRRAGAGHRPGRLRPRPRLRQGPRAVRQEDRRRSRPRSTSSPTWRPRSSSPA